MAGEKELATKTAGKFTNLATYVWWSWAKPLLSFWSSSEINICMMYYLGNNYFLSFFSLVCLVISVVMLCAPLNLIAIVAWLPFWFVHTPLCCVMCGFSLSTNILCLAIINFCDFWSPKGNFEKKMRFERCIIMEYVVGLWCRGFITFISWSLRSEKYRLSLFSS